MKLDLSRAKSWDKIMQWGVNDGVFPGGVLLVGNQQEILYYEKFGSAEITPNSRPVMKDTIYDLASLTKVVVTTTLVMQLIEKGMIRLDDPVDLFFPGFAVNGKENVRVRHLLTHCSGLAAWAPLYLKGENNQERIEYIKNLELDYPTGTKVVYSDLGFILLGELIQKVCKKPLDEVAKKEIFKPLRMIDTYYNPPKHIFSRIAATEFNNDYEMNMLEDTEGVNRREGLILGKVHDGNCFAMGGVTGHAGIFSTAKDVYHFTQMLLNGGRFNNKHILSPVTIEKMVQNYTRKILGGNRGLGWDKPGELSSGGDLISGQAFGHTGFSGTSIWIDPTYNLSVILLTNRVHPTCTTKHIRFRSLIHNMIFSSLIKE
ncbi:MAG: serine hydrolase [Halanaerobiales bacterium]|nr:serine hydrolase [Halanaerobiales bacterium]